MVPFEAFSHIYILRLWREPRELPDTQVEWRGEIESLFRGEKRYFHALDELPSLIANNLQGNPGIEFQVPETGRAGEGEMLVTNCAAQGLLINHGEQSHYTGRAWVEALPSHPRSNGMRRVVFEPGARSHWHRHSAGQILIVLAGIGQAASHAGVFEIRPGDLIFLPPGAWHWLGAAPSSFLVHLALNLPPPSLVVDDVEWGEVSELDHG